MHLALMKEARIEKSIVEIQGYFTIKGWKTVINRIKYFSMYDHKITKHREGNRYNLEFIVLNGLQDIKPF